jgi:hypothetical protein
MRLALLCFVAFVAAAAAQEVDNGNEFLWKESEAALANGQIEMATDIDAIIASDQDASPALGYLWKQDAGNMNDGTYIFHEDDLGE